MVFTMRIKIYQQTICAATDEMSIIAHGVIKLGLKRWKAEKQNLQKRTIDLSMKRSNIWYQSVKTKDTPFQKNCEYQPMTIFIQFRLINLKMREKRYTEILVIEQMWSVANFVIVTLSFWF